MTLRLQKQTAPGGAFTEIDIAAEKLSDFRVLRGYSHPAILSFVAHVPHHTIPIGYNVFLRFWEEGASDRDGTPYGESNPLFEGFLREITPGDEPHSVKCTAYDPTQISAHTIPIMSGPWQESGGQIIEGTGAVARLVYNCKIDNDPDFAFERGHDGTIGEIIAGILEDALLPLRYWNAAPSSGQAYESSDLSAFVFRPQEKMVFDSESIRSGINRLLQWEPAVRIIWVPGTRKWRFVNLYNAPEITLTLNDPTDKVLAFEMDRSLAGRYTAVKIYGPETTTIESFSTLDGSLAPVGDYTVLEVYNVSSEVRSYTTFQIVDPAKRRGAKLLKDWIYTPFGAYFYVLTRSPVLQYSFDGGNTWNTHQGPVWDFQNGIVSLGSSHIYLYIDPPPGLPDSDQRYFVPNAYRIIYAPYTTPLTVYAPDSPPYYAGTAYTEANVQDVLRLYEEMLAVGYEYGTPVTTETRLAQYQQFANNLLRQRQDIVYTGTVVLDGIRYEFDRLYRRVNFAGVDGNGQTVTTNWESIGAALTDVEFDFENNTTTLQFSTDQLELMGFSPEFLRQRLGIKALEQRSYLTSQYHYRTYTTFFGNRVQDLAGVTLTENFYYVDPDNGEVQR